MSKRKAESGGRKQKTIYSLDSPYPGIEWPSLSSEDSNTILELLCSLISPIGQHSSQFIPPSKGKREKKREKKALEASESPKSPISDHASQDPPYIDRPAPPEIADYLTIGFNNTTRILEALAEKVSPHKLQSQTRTSAQAKRKRDNLDVSFTGVPTIPRALVAVFISRVDQPSILSSHLPLLVATASLALPSSPAIRLVDLPKGAGIKLSTALNIPRASIIGLLEGAPHSAPLVGPIRKLVRPVEIPWLQDAMAATYLPVSIKATETTAPAEPKRARRMKASTTAKVPMRSTLGLE